MHIILVEDDLQLGAAIQRALDRLSYTVTWLTDGASAVDAILLVQLFPQDADAIMQQSRDIGWRRVVKGVHTLQDIYAGREFGQALAGDMLASPALRQDLADARAELEAAGLVSH